jgi:hypothetical protein
MYPESPLDAFLSSAMVLFDARSMRNGMMTCKEPLRVGDNGKLQVWADPEKPKAGPNGVVDRRAPRTMYVAAADTAEGVHGGDPSYLSINRYDTGEQVLAWRGVTTPGDFAVLCCRLAREYNMAILAFERNNHGHAALLKAQELGYPNLYQDEQFRNGWNTDGQTRVTMLDDL